MGWISKIFGKKLITVKEYPVIPYEINSDIFFADISHHEKNFDVSKYKQSYKLLIHKTTQATTMIDELHAQRKKECEMFGIKYIGYHFYRCFVDPIKQAQFYVQAHGDFHGLNPILDFEIIEKSKLSNGQTEDDLIKDLENFYLCLKEVQRLTGKTPIIYANLFSLKRLCLSDKFGEFYLWPARYNTKMEFVPFPFKTEKLFAFQYCDGGETYLHKLYQNSFEGIGNCDCNIYNKELDLFGLAKE